MGGIGTRGSALLVGVAALLFVVPVASARVEVLSPRAGAAVDGAVRVQVRVGRGTVTARLNGQRADRKVVRTAGGRREAILGAAQGLRHGSNTLVLVHRQRGRPTTRQSVRFTVRGRRPLASARTRGEPVAGAPVRLDARGSLPRPGRGKRLRYRWRVLRSPPGSRVRPDRAAFAAAAAAGQAPGTCGSNRGSAQTTSAGSLASDQLPVETGSGGTGAGGGTPQTGTTPTSTTPTSTTPTVTTPTSTTTTSTAPTPTTPTSTTTTSTSTTTTPATTTPTSTTTTSTTPTTTTPSSTTTTPSPAPVAPPPAPVSPAQTGLADVVAPTTSLTPDVPGCYQFELVATDGTAASTPDVVTVQASPPTPLVAIDTSAKQGSTYGIQVGDAFYPDTAPNALPLMQIVVLDRRTLAPVAFGGQSPGDKNAGNKIYSCQATEGCAAQIKDALKPLQDDVLVIASCQPGFIPSSPNEFPLLIDSLKSIGVDPPKGGMLTGPGQFAAVGIPGLPTGEARTWTSAALVTTPGLKGVLVKDQFDSYKLVSTHYIDLDTRAAGAGATSNVMQIGTQKYSAQLPSGATGGFQVVALSGFDLSLTFNVLVTTAPASASNVTGQLATMNAAIAKAVLTGERLVVLVTSIGSPADARNAIAGQWNDLADWIADQGGSQDAIQSYQSGQSYSLAGGNGIGQARGTEVGSMIDASSTGRITGVLTRDADWHFAPSGGELGVPPPSLMGVIYQQPTPWPAYNPAAMQYIAKQVGLGSDVRVNYWTQPYSQTVWQQYQGAIQTLKYPGDGKGFSRSDFTSLQSELFTEIDWLIKAKDFLTGSNNMGGLSQPFSQTGLNDWAELQDIAGKIDGGVQPPKQASASLEAFVAVLGDIFDIVSLGVGEAFAPAFELVGSTLAAGSDIASYAESGESVNDAYSTTVANYGKEFSTRMSDIQSAYQRLFDIAVSDWGKLCTIGTRQRCDPQSGGPSGPQLWQFTQDDQDQASLGLQQWSRRDIWRALLPAKFPLAFISASQWWQTSGHENSFPSSQASLWSLPNLYCGDDRPFANLPDSAQAQLSSETTATGSGFELWDIGAGTVPEASITDPLWQPPDPGGNPFTGGLGFHPSHFLFRAWPESQDYVNLAPILGPPGPVRCGWRATVPDTPAPPAGSNRPTSRSRADSSTAPNGAGGAGAKAKRPPDD